MTLLDAEYETQPKKINPRQFSLFCASNGLLAFPGPRDRIHVGVVLSIPDAGLLRKCETLKEKTDICRAKNR